MGRPGYDTYSAIVSLAYQLDSIKENESNKLKGLILMTGTFTCQTFFDNNVKMEILALISKQTASSVQILIFLTSPQTAARSTSTP